VLTDDGPLRIDIPRDRAGQFEPQLIGKHERRFTGFDDKIIAMYARGMSVREIQAFLVQMYNTEVSPDFISQVTDAVMDEVLQWQSRPLEAVYPVVFFDALRVKIREDAVVRNKAVFWRWGAGRRQPGHPGAVDRAHRRGQVLAQGLQRPEAARLPGHPDRRHRRPEGHGRGAGGGVSRSTLQTCIVHLLRNSLSYAGYKERKGLADALKPIYQAVSAEAAEAALEAFAEGEWGQRFPTVARRGAGRGSR
jgi:transposase-like protein